MGATLGAIVGDDYGWNFCCGICSVTAFVTLQAFLVANQAQAGVAHRPLVAKAVASCVCKTNFRMKGQHTVEKICHYANTSFWACA
eukprot:157618-Pelagomonas_calceolata.AAC.1